MARPPAMISVTFMTSLAPAMNVTAISEGRIRAMRPEINPMPRKRAAISSIYQPLARIP